MQGEKIDGQKIGGDAGEIWWKRKGNLVEKEKKFEREKGEERKYCREGKGKDILVEKKK